MRFDNRPIQATVVFFMMCFSFLRQRFVVAFVFPLLFLSFFIPVRSLQAEDDLSALFDQSDAHGDIEQLLFELQQLRLRKIPVNTATLEDLLLIPFLTQDDAQKVIGYREKKRQISSLAELENAIGAETARKVAPFLSFRQVLMRRVLERAGFRGSWNSRYFSEIPERKGLINGAYNGRSYKMYNRISASYGGVTANGVVENDIGEADLDDFASFSIAYGGPDVVERMILGGYTLSFGEGLLFGQSRYFSKGVDPLGVKLSGRRLKAYASGAENGFLQGAAGTFDLHPLSVTAFYSSNRIDASIEDGIVTTIRTSGYHRTESEIEHKDNVTEQVAGINLRYGFDTALAAGTVGGTLARYRYSVPLEDDGGVAGRHGIGGLEADLQIKRVNVFGEAAVTGNGESVSWIGGAGFSLMPGVKAVLAVRDYDSAYFSPFAGAFAERADDAANEEGYYAGVEADILKNLHVGAYYDVFRFPELGSHYRLPSTGDEAKLFLSWRQSPFLKAELLFMNQYKEEEKRLEDGSGMEYYQPVPFSTNRVRLDLITKPFRSLRLKTRGELKFVEGAWPDGEVQSDGWLVYQQANLKTGPFSLKARYTLFETDDFDSAVYVYEDDLPLVFTLKSYYGKGQAFFAVLSWDVLKQFELNARFAKTWYDDRDTYSSGNNERDTSAPASYHLGCALRF